MQFLKLFVFTFLSLNILIGCATAQNKSGRKDAGKTNEPPNKIRETKPPQFDRDEPIKTIAEGADSIVTTPFAFVARSPEAFEQLKKLVKNLPPGKIDFNKTAVVAVFAGEKNTGGYSIDIGKNAGKISVKVAAPPADAMVTQNISAPYKIALVEIEPTNNLILNLSKDFSGASKRYRVTSAEFNVSGGITGKLKSFRAEGAIDVLQFGELATFVFNLTAENGRHLNETTSGIVKDGKISIARIEAADFIDNPHNFLTAEGSVLKKTLSLAFLPSNENYPVSDAFSGGGKITATKTK